jgi:hypothetical protein
MITIPRFSTVLSATDPISDKNVLSVELMLVTIFRDLKADRQQKSVIEIGNLNQPVNVHLVF